MNGSVIVVGAGPVGLTVALCLVREGLVVTLLEQSDPSVTREWRGSTLHPPTLEILDSLGVAAEAIKGGVKVESIQYRDLELKEVVNFSYSLLEGEARFPFRIQFEQYKLLTTLRRLATSQQSLTLSFNSRVIDIQVNSDHVEVRYEHAEKEKSIAADFLVAADGSHSSVRKVLNIGMDGITYENLSAVAATRFDFGNTVHDLAPVSYWSGPLGRFSMIKTPDVWRLAISIAARESDELPSQERMRETLNANLNLLAQSPNTSGLALGSIELEQIQWYRSHQRVASRFVADRVLLAGDAAHLTSTNGGMGLNAGVVDAAIAAEVICRAAQSGDIQDLKRYEIERRNYMIDEIQPTTTSTHQSANARAIEDRQSRLAILAEISSSDEQSRAFLLRASMMSGRE